MHNRTLKNTLGLILRRSGQSTYIDQGQVEVLDIAIGRARFSVHDAPYGCDVLKWPGAQVDRRGVDCRGGRRGGAAFGGGGGRFGCGAWRRGFGRGG